MKRYWLKTVCMISAAMIMLNGIETWKISTEFNWKFQSIFIYAYLIVALIDE